MKTAYKSMGSKNMYQYQLTIYLLLNKHLALKPASNVNVVSRQKFHLDQSLRPVGLTVYLLFGKMRLSELFSDRLICLTFQYV